MDKIWEIALGYLRQRVAPYTYSELFAEEAIVNVERRGSIVYVCVSDTSRCDDLRDYHFNELEEALFVASGEHLTPILVDYSKESIPSPSQQAQQPILDYSAVFNPRYTFDSFVVGSSNRFAHAAAMAVADSLYRTYNPLFLYGGSGLGKTHLMHAIGQAVRKRDPFSRVCYVSSETFTNEFIYMLRQGRLETFKSRYRNADILLIDDIQFLTNKEQIQEEFFHTFNTLHEAGKQIVISSDRHPKELNPLEERLRSRFSWGLITDIQPPDWETRCAILQQKADSENMKVDNEVISFIADKIKANIRELEGALNQVMYYSMVYDKDPLDVHMAQVALRDIIQAEDKPKLTIAKIQRVVAEYFNLAVSDLKGKNKARSVALPRQMAMYLCRDVLGATLPQIGRDFGNRDHATVIHACNKIAEKRTVDVDLDDQLREIENLLQYD